MDYSRCFRDFGALLVAPVLLVPLAMWAAEPAAVFTNPIGFNSVPALLNNLIRWILGLVGFIALLSLIWGGVMYIISFGSEAGIKKAKTIIIWSIVGLVVILLAFFIVRTVANILGVAGI